MIQSVTSGLNTCIIPIIDLEPGKHEMLCRLVKKKGKPTEVLFLIEKLAPKYNEVKINRLTGGLIVDNEPFFPFGFYCYSPVQPSLAEEEVVNGFNMMSPYQRIQDRSLSERRAYMDRCAALGMKVHYNLLSVAGGGGVKSGRPGDLTLEEKKALLYKEIMEFKDHPALLAWYMSDEPVGQGIPTEPLEEMYNFIRNLDPYHPVTMVFMAPAKARGYAAAMDIVMADPYPVPTYPVTDVERVIRRLKKEFLYTKPVFLVPQAFGGAEWWRREPTAGEIRSMTYQAIVEGATGIQYFVRHGLNFFPKSVVAWNTCSDMAHEVAEISPELIMGELAGRVKSLSSGIRVRAMKYNNYLTIIAVNVKNNPVSLKIQLDKSYSTRYARLIFEDRKVKIQGRVINDMIDGFGSRVYKIVVSKANTNPTKFHAENMYYNSGFEEFHSPGVASGSYARYHGDRGGTYFLDSRISFEGEHSIRMITPEAGKGPGLSFFPFQTRPGYSTTISVWARAKESGPSWEAYEPDFLERLIRYSFGIKSSPVFRMGVPGIDMMEFDLSTEWKNYKMSVFVESIPGRSARLNPYIELLTKGTAWFDQLEVFPDLDMSSTVKDSVIEVKLKNMNGKGDIYYSLGKGDLLSYSGDPVMICSSTTLNAALFEAGSQTGTLKKEFVIHSGLGAAVRFKYPFSLRNTLAGGRSATDGLVASDFYGDGLWLKFTEKDVVATVDLKKPFLLKQISVSFLQNLRVAAFIPSEVDFSISFNGKDFRPVYMAGDTLLVSKGQVPFRKTFAISSLNDTARYIRIFAKNYGLAPGRIFPPGKKSVLFMDEIIINEK
jgi:hypothetical protein